jgi:hypothetical protein
MLQILIITLTTNPAITRDTRLLLSTVTTTTAVRHSYQLLPSPFPTTYPTKYHLGVTIQAATRNFLPRKPRFNPRVDHVDLWQAN